MAAALEATGDYRVLRKIQQRNIITPPDGTPTKNGLFVDVETTGLDPDRHEIIELAMVPFTYSKDGRIFSTGSPFQQLQEPKEPISAEITAITGITQEMVRGHQLDSHAVEAFMESADLIIAHNLALVGEFIIGVGEPADSDRVGVQGGDRTADDGWRIALAGGFRRACGGRHHKTRKNRKGERERARGLHGFLQTVVWRQNDGDPGVMQGPLAPLAQAHDLVRFPSALRRSGALVSFRKFAHDQCRT